MPTYNATGITATLSTCDLQSSLSNVIDRTQGKQQRLDATRIQNVYSSATELNERPIGEDGSEKGVIQFVGVHGDMPLYAVEVGTSVSIKKKAMADVLMGGMEDDKADEDLELSSPLPALGSDDSPLTSLGATPTPTFLSFDLDPSPNKITQSLGLTQSPLHNQSLEQALQAAHTLLNPFAKKALVLNIELSQNSFLPRTPNAGQVKPASGAIPGKDLKIEIFVNGRLADVSLVSARRSPIHPYKEMVTFAGTRVHRQIEKPWLYSPYEYDVLSTDLEGNVDTNGNSKLKWNAVSSLLIDEGKIRGTNKWGDGPPSAEFLMEIASLKMPDRLKDTDGIGIIDVVITAGSGRKLGPETPYIMRPDRMNDSNYKMSDQRTAVPLQLPNGILDVEDEPMYDDPFYNNQSVKSPLPPAESSPDIPLRQDLANTRRPARPTGSTRTTSKDDFRKSLGLDVDPSLPIERYETARKKIGKSGRTLGQRLGDLKKMSPKNRSHVAESLREEFQSALSKQNDRPLKKLQFNVLDNNPSNDREEGLASTDLDTNLGGFMEGTMDPKHMLLPTGFDFADPEAVLTQSRIDMALSSGAPSNGPLLRRIASTSPQHTPQKKTRASALAGSPTHIAVKPPKRRNTDAPQTPKRRKSATDTSHLIAIGEPVPFVFPNTPSGNKTDRGMTPVRGSASQGANRSSRKWNPKEQTIDDILKEFKSPEECSGSCVTYDEDQGVRRQIGKARGGVFCEECVVVGMRFIVVG